MGSLIDRALALAALDRQLRQSLPVNVAPHCRLANVNGDRLVFLVDSPTWKARLRLHTDLLLQAARAAGCPVRELTVKVATMLPPPPKSAPHDPLSPAAAAALSEAARHIGDHDLKRQLLDLASLAEK